MTYNFDADRWYENQRGLLVARRERGELDESAFAEALGQVPAPAESSTRSGEVD
jgi:hypothetical protein